MTLFPPRATPILSKIRPLLKSPSTPRVPKTLTIVPHRRQLPEQFAFVGSLPLTSPRLQSYVQKLLYSVGLTQFYPRVLVIHRLVSYPRSVIISLLEFIRDPALLLLTKTRVVPLGPLTVHLQFPPAVVRKVPVVLGPDPRKLPPVTRTGAQQLKASPRLPKKKKLALTPPILVPTLF